MSFGYVIFGSIEVVVRETVDW